MEIQLMVSQSAIVTPRFLAGDLVGATIPAASTLGANDLVVHTASDPPKGIGLTQLSGAGAAQIHLFHFPTPISFRRSSLM